MLRKDISSRPRPRGSRNRSGAIAAGTIAACLLLPPALAPSASASNRIVDPAPGIGAALRSSPASGDAAPVAPPAPVEAAAPVPQVPGTAPIMKLPEFAFNGEPEPYGAVAPWECSPELRPGTQAFGDMLLAASGGLYPYEDVRPCNADWGVTYSQHKTGRAIDFMVDSRSPQGRLDGAALLRWLFEPVDGIPHARLRRLGIVEIIWNAKIWTTETDSVITSSDTATWRPYRGLGCSGDPVDEGTECHFDHFHFSLSAAGAAGLVSFHDPASRR